MFEEIARSSGNPLSRWLNQGRPKPNRSLEFDVLEGLQPNRKPWGSTLQVLTFVQPDQASPSVG